MGPPPQRVKKGPDQFFLEEEIPQGNETVPVKQILKTAQKVKYQKEIKEKDKYGNIVREQEKSRTRSQKR